MRPIPRMVVGSSVVFTCGALVALGSLAVAGGALVMVAGLIYLAEAAIDSLR